MAESTRLGELFNSNGVHLVDLQVKLAKKDAVVRSIVQDLCAMLGLPLRGLFENFCAGLIKSVSGAFRAGFTYANLHTILLSMASLSVFREVLYGEMVEDILRVKTRLMQWVTLGSSKLRCGFFN